jgi:hypothetical protein
MPWVAISWLRCGEAQYCPSRQLVDTHSGRNCCQQTKLRSDCQINRQVTHSALVKALSAVLRTPMQRALNLQFYPVAGQWYWVGGLLPNTLGVRPHQADGFVEVLLPFRRAAAPGAPRIVFKYFFLIFGPLKGPAERLRRPHWPLGLSASDTEAKCHLADPAGTDISFEARLVFSSQLCVAGSFEDSASSLLMLPVQRLSARHAPSRQKTAYS